MADYKNPYLSPTGQNDPEHRWLYHVEFAIGGLGIGEANVLKVNATSVSIPTYQIEATPIQVLNQDVKVAGRPTLGEMTVTFMTGYKNDNNVVKILEAWSRKIYTPSSEELGYAEDYKAEGNLIVYQPKMTEFKQYKFQGAWPTNIGEISYEWAASDNVTRSVTFSVDKVLDPDDQS